MKIVFTGASGSGKTTIINRLDNIGLNLIEEQSRMLINNGILPWNDRIGFQNVVEKLQMQLFLKNNNCIFDRGIVDEIGYRRMFDLEIPEEIYDFCNNNRYDLVFMFYPYKQIYFSDEIRIENFEASCKAFDYVLKAYNELNYNIIVVPNTTIEKRIEFIKKQIKLNI